MWLIYGKKEVLNQFQFVVVVFRAGAATSKSRTTSAVGEAFVHLLRRPFARGAGGAGRNCLLQADDVAARDRPQVGDAELQLGLAGRREEGVLLPCQQGLLRLDGCARRYVHCRCVYFEVLYQ